MHSFNWTLERIRSNLRGLQKDKIKLAEEDIMEAVESFKTLIDSLEKMPASSSEFFFTPFSYNDYEKLNLNEYELIVRKLKSDFNVRWIPGKSMLKGKDQKNRNTTWWTDKEKPGKDYYWNQYKNHYLLDKFNHNIVDTLEIDADSIVNNLGNPNDTNFDRYGMVVGHVQAGKTGNYSAVICKAADAGYRFIVVISGTNNNLLRNQAQQRINEAFIGQNDNGLCGVGVGHKRDIKNIPFSLTTDLKDFDKVTQRRLIGANLDTMNVPIVLVIKKNAINLRTLTTWLTDQYKDVISQHSMLMIDDESDYASINTKTEDDPATINGLIRTLIALFKKSSYVAYTATPSANIFIDYEAETPELGLDLFPKDFIFPLEAPDNYIGATKIFNNPKGKFLVTVDDNAATIPIKHPKDHYISALPETLKEAIRIFIINIAIRNLRGHAEKHNSMLVHVSLNTAVHMGVFNKIEEYYHKIRNSIVSYGKMRNSMVQSTIFKDIENTLNKHYADNLEFNWSEILDELNNCINSIILRQVHTRNKIPLIYEDKSPVNVIVVGGLSLARGFTLEGLSVSYFLRGTKLNDTLMQMARWFGYRDEYEDLCRVFMTSELQENYRQIELQTNDLFEKFHLMADAGKTPEDYGLSVIEDPENALQITAKNKMKYTAKHFLKINLTGKLYETVKIFKAKNNNLVKNLEIITNFVNKLIIEQKSSLNSQDKGDILLWKNINKSYVESFINSFIVAEGSDSFIKNGDTRMPMAFLKPFIKQHDDNWDVCLYEGDGQILKLSDNFTIRTQQRTINDDKDSYREIGNRRQISSGPSEAVNLSKKDREIIKANRRAARAFKGRNNLLMLHIIERKHDPKKELIAAFGVSISGDGISGGKNTQVRMNKVMIDLISSIQNEEVESEL